MSTNKQTIWHGSMRCDICNTDLHDVDHIHDAQTFNGPWATMCTLCYVDNVRLPHHYGPGIGQHYVKQPDGLYHKTEG